jgi:hypothetical protein
MTMRNFILAAMAAAFGASLFGCAEPTTAGVLDPEDEPTLETRNGGNGSSGTNGLSDISFAAFSSKLATAARLYPLVEPGTDIVSEGVRQTLQLGGSLAGQTVFHYAMRCVLPANAEVRAYGVYYQGLGHLPQGEKWAQGPLPKEDIEDLMACMAIHVNPYGLTVPILLVGPDVKDDPLPHPDYNVPEALWMSYVTVDDVPNYVVWPFEDVQKVCSSNVEAALKNRLCGQQPGECNLKVGRPEDCRLDEEAGGYFCFGKPVIESRLEDSGIPYLYQLCQ